MYLNWDAVDLGLLRLRGKRTLLNRRAHNTGAGALPCLTSNLSKRSTRSAQSHVVVELRDTLSSLFSKASWATPLVLRDTDVQANLQRVRCAQRSVAVVVAVYREAVNA